MDKKNIVVAVDIGTTKVLAIVAEIFPVEKEFKVIGYGMNISRGLQKGVIVDVEEAMNAIESAISSAEHMANINIEKAYIGIAGKHIESLVSHTVVTLGKMPREIVETDKMRLEDFAETKIVPVDRKVIHKIVYNYKIDDRSEVVKNPVGMVGMKLEADVHVVTGGVQSIDSLIRCINKLDIAVEDVVLEPLASAKAVLSDTEKKLGCVLIDIGGGTTDIAIYKNEKLIYTSVIPVGGEHYTTDLATILGIELKVADRLKKDFSTLHGFDEDEIFDLPSYSGGDARSVELGFVKEIIDARTDEILEIVGKKIEMSGYAKYLQNGLVFTGGSSKIMGLREKAELYFKMPVRIGIPVKMEGMLNELLKPEDATGVGLLLYGIEKYLAGKNSIIQKDDSDSMMKTLFEKMKSWFENLF